MNADKKHASRGLGGARRTTAMPLDESPPRSRLTPTSRDRPAGFRGGRKGDTATLHGGGQAAHPEDDRYLYRGGQAGALLRTEGLYASNLTTWRRQRTEGVLSALNPHKRGRKESARHPLRAENEKYQRQVSQTH